MLTFLLLVMYNVIDRDTKQLRPALTMEEFHQFLLEADSICRVGITHFPDGGHVSTVLLYQLLNIGAVRNFIYPFETMVFGVGGPFEYVQERYDTWEQAEVGHRRIVARVKRYLWQRRLQQPRPSRRKGLPTRRRNKVLYLQLA